MRAPLVLACLFLAAPADAMEFSDTPTWSAEAHVLKGPTSYDTVLVFQRTAPGVWNVRAECQTTDVKTKSWKSYKATGTARMHEGFVVGQLVGRLL